MSWYDSNNIIFIGYRGGAGGIALRYLLGLSPDTDVLLYDNAVRNDGAAHEMTARSSVTDDPVSKIPFRLHQFVDDKSETVYNDLWSHKWNTELVRELHDKLDSCFDMNGQPLGQGDTSVKMIIADHLPCAFARAVFPNCVAVCLQKSPEYSMKNYYLKNLLEPVHAKDGNYDAGRSKTRIAALLEKKGLEPTAANYKQMIRDMYDTIQIQSDPGALSISADKLFNAQTWQAEYIRLVELCGLEPNYQAAGNFINEYAALQYDRHRCPVRNPVDLSHF